MSLTINDMATEAYNTAREKGFHENHPRIKSWERLSGHLDRVRMDISVKLALIHSELSEALEEVRNNEAPLVEYAQENGKPEGLLSELADVVIRVGDLAASYDLDLEGMVEHKMDFNRQRPTKHGKNF